MQEDDLVDEEVEDVDDFFENDDGKDKLVLDGEIYSFTFYKFIKFHHPDYLAQLMMKCFVAFLVQVLVIYVKVYEVVKDASPIYRGSPAINCTRLVCCYLMHYI